MKLGELASRLGLELRGDPAIDVIAPAPIEAAGPGMITFLGREKYLAFAQKTAAACVIAPRELADEVKTAVLVSTNPYADFARTLAIFFPPSRPPEGIDASARIAPGAKIGEGAAIGALTAIGAGVAIGRNAVIHPNVTIYPGVTVGDDFVCHSGVSIRDGVTIGNRVLIHNGAVIGADGFGFIEHNGGLVKIPQIGTVIIEDDVEIGANTTIDRAMLGATVIRRSAKLDNLVQIAHNCEVGEFSRFAGQVGLAGSVKVGNWCEFGGQAGCADHIMVGDRTRVAAQAGLHRSVAPSSEVVGTPAIEGRVFKRMVAVEPRLPEMLRRLRAVEARLGIDARRK
jgi:UDP-3-O-[3-hydroxymyristoyl] glucosamine N-acyltransferase